MVTESDVCRLPVLVAWLGIFVSELFAGTFLMLIFWSVLSKQPFLMTAVFLSLFSWTKPDLLLPGIVLGCILIFWKWGEWRNIIYEITVWGVIMILFILPGIVIQEDAYRVSSGRSLFSFCQHYADMFAQHQIVNPPPNPWENCKMYLTPNFGNAENIITVIHTNPAKYMDFVFLSAAYSLRRSILGNLFFLIPLGIWGTFISHERRLNFAIGGAFITNTGLILLLSYFHIRYQARFYPLILGIIFLGLQEASSKKQISVLTFLTFLGLWQIKQFIPILLMGHFFPD